MAYFVYRCYDAIGRLLYVGCTRNIWNRLQAHKSGTWWAPTITKVVGKVYASKTIARRVEREAIANELPRWNVMGKWAHRAMWAPEDWRDYLLALERNNVGTSSNYVRKHIANVQRHMSQLGIRNDNAAEVA